MNRRQVHLCGINRPPVQYFEYIVYEIRILVLLAHIEKPDDGGIAIGEPKLKDTALVGLKGIQIKLGHETMRGLRLTL
jgi:hypothetical protein